MSLKTELENQYKEALKGQKKLKVSVIRMIKAAIKNEEIKKRGDLDDTEVLRILSTLQKQRNESIQQFQGGGRQDLADKEQQEIQIIKSFLPEELSPEQIKKEVEAAIAETEASSVKDLGKVMKVLMPRLTGRADGKEVSAMVKELLLNG